MPESDAKTVSNIVRYASVSAKYIQVLATGGAIIVSALNYSIASKLTPLQQSVGTLVNRVEAIEADRKGVAEWRQRTAILEQRVSEDHASISEIKQDVKDIRNFLLNK